MTNQGDSGSPLGDPWKRQLDALGGFIRMQRQLAHLSLREMAELTSVSNAYLSQVERGMHQPSLKVLQSIAQALKIPARELLNQAGLSPTEGAATDPGPEQDAPCYPDTESAIKADRRLSQAQRQALLGVYRSFLDED
ncbi:helix-turn-helix domain-containing protein [Hoyosella altamirensis]|uniref:Transcriptional regulator with XRE-family HTH domain n=1 Tax=Hoyosella altamirensis TaxID=616997 RepID=A0A839RPZ9_9ACTN|nr:helix-turn-helix transcriptional regulator [Hoyosella altamirensis]MBB3038477.1 transcriptional regulator with XRE-family HTH domain [Hoyosella altamirensis]